MTFTGSIEGVFLEFDGKLAETIRNGRPVFGETDDEACRRIFGGRTFECRGYGCTKRIGWIGACDECIKRIESHKDERTADERMRDRLRSLGVPELSLEQSWETWTRSTSMDEPALAMTRSVSRLMEWRGSPNLVVIAGPTGTGKTHLAVAALKQFMADNPAEKRVRFWDEYALVEAYKEGFRRPDLPDVLKEAIEVDLLVFDDMGSVQSTDFSAGVRSGFLSQRIDRGRWTIVTTNLTQAEIKHSISERIASRMMTALVINTVGAGNYRRKMKPADEPGNWSKFGAGR